MCRTTPRRASRASSPSWNPASFAVETDTGARSKSRSASTGARGKAIVDFTGTSAQQPDTFNAPEPITRACVLYVFRTLVDDDIPLNAGCLRHIEIVVPEGSMLAPRYPAAVAAGNVETSQTIVNCLYGALGVLGSAQGTMNNLTFGNAARRNITRRSAPARRQVRASTARLRCRRI